LRGWRENRKEITWGRGPNKLIGKFKMASGDVNSIGGWVMDYTYIPTGIKRELMRFGITIHMSW
jgi:hypothetical protein